MRAIRDLSAVLCGVRSHREVFLIGVLDAIVLFPGEGNLATIFTACIVRFIGFAKTANNVVVQLCYYFVVTIIYHRPFNLDFCS